MRFFFLMGAGNDASVEYEMTLTAEVSGGTVGLIGHGINVDCRPTMLTTSNGTLLLADGFNPVMRMRQNEKSLSAAGVPAPRTPLRILDADGIAADGEAQIPQEVMKTVSYDYSEYGDLAGTITGGNAIYTNPTPEQLLLLMSQTTNLTYTPLGARSRDKRHEDYLALLGELGTDLEAINNNGNAVGFDALRYQFLVPYRSGTNAYWRKTKMTFQIRNKTSTANSDIFVNFNGRYQAFMRYLDKDGLPSDPSPISNDVLLVNARYVYYKDVETPTDPRVVRRQIFRNIDGSSDAFYLDIDTDDLTSDRLVSYNTDAQLENNFWLPAVDPNGYELFNLYGQPPSDKPFLAEFKGTVFAMGKRSYRKGNVSVTNGSNQVTGIGTNWKKSMVGWRITIGIRQYTIYGVDEDTQVITLDRVYEGATAPYLAYGAEPYFANGNLIYYSHPGYPESWPIKNSMLVSEDGDEITGAVVFGGNLWALKQRSIYSLSFTNDFGRDGSYTPVCARGCINQACAILVEGLCLAMDRIGIYAFDGGRTPAHLSMAVDDLFRFEGTGLRINWQADTCHWHGTYTQELKTARWHVAMQGDDLPRHALCFNYLTKEFWIEEYPYPITASCIGTAQVGRPLLGSIDGEIYQPDLGPLDIVKPQGTRFNVAAVESPFRIQLDDVPSFDCTGLPIAIVNGLGRGQWRIVLSQDDDILEVDTPFLVLPSTEEGETQSVVQIGAVPYRLLTPELNVVKSEDSAPLSFVVDYKPSKTPLETYVTIIDDGRDTYGTAATSRWGALSSNESSQGARKIDLSHTDGISTINRDSHRERDVAGKYSIQALIEGFSGQTRPIFNEFVVPGTSNSREVTV